MASAPPEPEPVIGVPVTGVVWGGFCLPYTTELVTKKKRTKGVNDQQFEVYDMNGNVVLQIDFKLWGFPKKRVHRDPAGFPILTMRQTANMGMQEWIVHRGETTEDTNFLFKLQRSSLFKLPIKGISHLANPLQLEMRFDVFLRGNISEDACDFHVTKCFSPHYHSFLKAYKGDTIIAEAKEELPWGSFCRGKGEFKVKVYPGIDYAFIVTLVFIVNETFVM